jgi:hypothetical protein
MMGETLGGVGEKSPPIAETILEVVGNFPSCAALDDAIRRLEFCGFPRTDLSLPEPAPPSRATPETGAEDPHMEDDNETVRALHTGLAGSAAALLAAGVTVATGGFGAPAAIAAIAAGAAGGGLAFSISKGSEQDLQKHREALAAEGRLLLAARIADEAKLACAEDAMRAAGATRIEHVLRA